MRHAPFSLLDSLIAYGDDKRVARVSQTLAALHHDAAVSSILGIFSFSDDDSVHADHWECHPAGDETLYVLEGRLLVAIDLDGVTEEVVIEKGQAFIVPKASWHRLRVLEPGRLLVFTPRAGTTLRPHVSETADAKRTLLS